MEKFKASNGLVLVPHEDGSVRWEAWWSPIFVSNALREFFQAERDEELGRWRSKKNPVWTGVVDERQNMVLFRNDDGLRGFSVDLKTRNYSGWVEEIRVVAAEYLDAHPEPKPWHAAVEGEVWLLKFSGKEFPAIFQAGRFRDHGGSWEAGDISFARRIWPEGVSDG